METPFRIRVKYYFWNPSILLPAFQTDPLLVCASAHYALKLDVKVDLARYERLLVGISF
ncbi:hypothetical protein [Parachlamydia sp. AcF125]|uniref:hypothetical protein n=1 Tax=Parachlamydia sp. AcF125 TaxID=2795736 RepID=UPI001BC9071B|nr:hypothetical protein [Parachlamydia sp. AcF125]